MARAFNGSNQYAATSGGPFSLSLPLTIVGWAYMNSSSGVQQLFGVQATTANYPTHRVIFDGTNMAAQTFDGTTSGKASYGTISLSTWQHWAGVFPSVSSRQLFLNGAQVASDTTSTTAFTSVNAGIGAQTPNSVSFYFNGNLAEVAIFSATLVAAEVLALAGGVSPRRIRPGALVFYTPLFGLSGASTEPDLSGARNSLSLTGSPGQVNHCPVTLFTRKTHQQLEYSPFIVPRPLISRPRFEPAHYE